MDLVRLWEKLPESEKKRGYDLLLRYKKLVQKSDPDYLFFLSNPHEWTSWMEDVKELRLAFFGSLYEETFLARYFFRTKLYGSMTSVGFKLIAGSELALYFRRIIAGVPRSVRYLELNYELERTPEKWPSGSSLMHTSFRKKRLDERDRDFG